MNSVSPVPPLPCPFEDGRGHIVTWRGAAWGPGYRQVEWLDCQTCRPNGRVIMVWRGVLETVPGKAVPFEMQPEGLRARMRFKPRRNRPPDLFVDLRRKTVDRPEGVLALGRP